MNFFEKRFLKNLLKFSKFVHEYRLEVFSEQEEKVYQKNLEKLRNLFGVEKAIVSLDVIDTSVLKAHQRELLQEFRQNSPFIKVRYREMVWFIWSNPRCTFSHVEREVICYMLQTLGNSSEEYYRNQQAQKQEKVQSSHEIEGEREKIHRLNEQLMQVDILQLKEMASGFMHNTFVLLRMYSSDKKILGETDYHQFIFEIADRMHNLPELLLCENKRELVEELADTVVFLKEQKYVDIMFLKSNLQMLDAMLGKGEKQVCGLYQN
ncbi:hypothetical protein U0X36_25925 [Bacillus thuringiensis]|uniref:Uncharacterized protein n=1 Tax=Bacillus cereus (strain VD146) TaxID=1053236 RepID=R8ME70_BACCX|nr:MULTISPECIES: hypothetical protein [Bacillus cereus group]EOP32339.1 hypothetical protein IK1_05875 [Bacillus cereus VD146]MDZ3956253.1 hypothetical protein [Bacillus thuringiensis]RGP43387.1 hypothetical protein BTW32_29705 [Bacillus thuringiensis]